MAKRRYSYEERHRTVNGVKLKRCTKCKRWKKESEFRKDRTRKDGLRIYCKACDSASARKRYQKNGKSRKAVRDYLRYEERHRTVRGSREKLCSRCKKWKTEDDFSRHSKSRDGLSFSCKECDRKRYEPNRKTGRRYLRYEERHRVVDGVKQKRCSTCKRWKARSDFYKDSRYKDGLEGRCKKCMGKANRDSLRKRLAAQE
jgi:hypothetical protein